MEASVEFLIFGGNARAAQRVATDLEHLGLQAESSTSEAEARAKFLASGGHGWLLITDDASPGSARRLARGLSQIDPDLKVLVFGAGLQGEAWPQLHRVRSLHPGSRAGLGAVQRLLATL